jgi:hypothetical protein
MKTRSASLLLSVLIGWAVLSGGRVQGQIVLDQNSGRDPYCEVNPSAAQCAGTAMSCGVSPDDEACRGTVAACSNDPSTPDCSDSKIFCQRNPAADRCQLARQAAVEAQKQSGLITTSPIPNPTPNSGGPTGAAGH